MFKLNMENIDIRKIPLFVAAAILLIGIPLGWGSVGILGNVVLLALVVGIVPFIFISYFEMQRIKAIEDQLPAFMLDIAETQKAGVMLPEALRIASKTDYGKLSPEIKRISDRISWGATLQEALSSFSNRMKGSDLTRRVVRIIIEAYTSGGDIAKTMEATAEDIITIKEAEKERKTVMSQHVAVMYAIYFVFIGIIVGLSKTLIPMLQMNVEAGAVFGGIFSFQDPCAVCIQQPQLFCISCSLYAVLCAMFGLGTGAACYYRGLFLLMAIVQGICSGLVAGQIGEGSALAGFKHSVIMTFSAFALLMIMLHAGFL